MNLEDLLVWVSEKKWTIIGILVVMFILNPSEARHRAKFRGRLQEVAIQEFSFLGLLADGFGGNAITQELTYHNRLIFSYTTYWGDCATFGILGMVIVGD